MLACLSTNGKTLNQASEQSKVLLVATANGLFRLERFFATSRWQIADHKLKGKHVSAVLYEPRTGLIVAGAHYDTGGIFISHDEGHTWEEHSDGLASKHVYSLAAQDRNGQVILYAGTEPAAGYRSEDLGQTWTVLSHLTEVPGKENWTFPAPPNIAHIKSIAIDPRAIGTIYVGIEQGGLLKSDDDGQTWRVLDSYDTPEDLFPKTQKPSTSQRALVCTGAMMPVRVGLTSRGLRTASVILTLCSSTRRTRIRCTQPARMARLRTGEQGRVQTRA